VPKPETSRTFEKRNFYLPTCIWRPVGVISSEFRRHLLRHKTSVLMLSLGVVFDILNLAVLTQYRLVTDRRTDGRTDTR